VEKVYACAEYHSRQKYHEHGALARYRTDIQHLLENRVVTRAKAYKKCPDNESATEMGMLRIQDSKPL
jgi:hypothetical protein